MRFVYSIFFLGFLLISGCTDPATQTQSNVYYDVAGFVKQQITSLSKQKPLVSKSVLINQERNQQTIRDLNWSRELELFIQADINKPALRSSYQIARPDSLTYRYTLKSTEERLTVRSLLVQLDSISRQPRRIEAVLQTSNPLYTSERHVLLESGPIGANLATGRQWRVQHYKVDGFQKLPYFDKNTFWVEGRLQ